MDIFAQFIENIDIESENKIRMNQAKTENAGQVDKPGPLEDIKVAVIDDGIDGFQDELYDNIAAGASFCRSSDSGSLIRTYYVASGGHGTKMAQLIRRVCPKVKLYVARLQEYKSPTDKKRFITARSAAEVRIYQSLDYMTI